MAPAECTFQCDPVAATPAEQDHIKAICDHQAITVTSKDNAHDMGETPLPVEDLLASKAVPTKSKGVLSLAVDMPDKSQQDPEPAYVTLAPGGDQGKPQTLTTLLRRHKAFVLGGLLMMLLLVVLVPVLVTQLSQDSQHHAGRIGVPPPPIRTNGEDQLITEEGRQVHLRGVNYFGFNNHQTMLDGLWAPPDMDLKPQTVADMATVTYQLSLLGFNAIRLPFIFTDLFTAKPRSFTYPCKNSTMEEIKARTTDPTAAATAGGKLLPKPKYWPERTHADWCNEYVPNDNVLERFLWTVRYFVASGFYVLIDYHPTKEMKPDHAEYPIMTQSKKFASHWARLWDQVVSMPEWKNNLRGRVLVTLMNEPDGNNMTWHAQPGKSGLTEMLIAAMDKIEGRAPHSTLYFIAGGGQILYDGEPAGKQGIAWGNCFITNATLLQRYSPPLSDPNKFFQTLLRKPYRRRVVLEPHLYSTSVTNIMYNRTEAAKLREWARFTESWGYLTKEGYCHKGDCQRFPVAIGEMGGRFERDPSLPNEPSLDYIYYINMLDYFNLVGAANDNRHNRITNWFWWSYNANSWDTGGIVTDDWLEFDWFKLTFMRERLGLRTWWDVSRPEELQVYEE